MNNKMVMIDLETLSTKHNACIGSIGAVKFDDDKIISSFKVNIDAKSCKDVGLHISKDTVNWWGTQSKEARDAWMTDPRSIHDALALFEEWYGTRSMWTWGYGANFDIVIMESAFEAIGGKEPWKYTDVCCLRTITNITGQRISRTEGTHHDALVDARNQAIFLQKFLKGDA